jgi:hypothetical protein
VCECFGKAFHKAKEEAINPFQADKEEGREIAPPSLVRRQVRRGHLEAIKPVGAGQFGQVCDFTCLDSVYKVMVVVVVAAVMVVVVVAAVVVVKAVVVTNKNNIF